MKHLFSQVVRSGHLFFTGIFLIAIGPVPFAMGQGTDTATEATQTNEAPQKETIIIGAPAPDLDIEHWIQDGEGKFDPVTKFETGKVYVVEFWATWCGPCVATMPHLAEIQTKYADQGVQIISISDEPLDTIQEFLEGSVSDEEKQTYADLTKVYCLTTDPDNSSHESYMEFAKQSGIPCAFLIGKRGKIEWIGHPGEIDGPLEAIVNDSWDREIFAKEFMKEFRQREIANRLGDMLQKEQFAEALQFIEELLEESPNGSMASALQMQRFQIVANAWAKSDRTLVEIGKEALEASESDSIGTLRIVRMVQNLMERGKLETNDLPLLAIESAEKFTDESNDQETVPPRGRYFRYLLNLSIAQLRMQMDDLDQAETLLTKVIDEIKEDKEVGPQFRVEQFQAFLEQIKKRRDAKNETQANDSEEEGASQEKEASSENAGEAVSQP